MFKSPSLNSNFFFITTQEISTIYYLNWGKFTIFFFQSTELVSDRKIQTQAF